MHNINKTYTPSNKEIQEMNDLFLNEENSSIYQDPKYALKNKNQLFFYIKNSNKNISSYCIVKESSLSKIKTIKTAHIYFGVISKNIDHKNLILNHIINYYKNKIFSEIYIFYLNENFKYDIKSSTFKLDNLKRGTLHINLNLGFDNIKNNFSKHLKRNLKKIECLNLNIKLLGQKDFENAYNIYVLMSKKRGISFLSYSEFNHFYDYSQNKGLCIGCFYDDMLIGGMICIIQGNRIEYFIGYTDPNYKHLPQSHLTFYTAIEMSTKLNLVIFDMGGAVQDVSSSDQIFNINKFKLGFTKEFIPYQNSEKIIANKFTYLVKRIYLYIQNILVK